MDSTVVILTKVPGHLPIKTRLWSLLGEAGACALYVEMVRQTFALARRFDPVPTLAYSPPEADAEAAFKGITPCRLLAIRALGGPFGLQEALDASWCGKPLIALGGDAPDLPPGLLGEALNLLSTHDAALVPTPDGGFSCLVLTRPVPDLGHSFEFGSGDTCERVRRFLEAQGQKVATLDPWPDVDTPEDLAAWERRAGSADT